MNRRIKLLVPLSVLALAVPAARAEEGSTPVPPQQEVLAGTVFSPVPTPDTTPTPEPTPDPTPSADPTCAYPCGTNQTDETDPYSNDVCNEWMLPDHGIYADRADDPEFAADKDKFCNIQSEEENQAVTDEVCADPDIPAEDRAWICEGGADTEPTPEPTDAPTDEPTAEPTDSPSPVVE